jgi:hypothetical protein
MTDPQIDQAVAVLRRYPFIRRIETKSPSSSHEDGRVVLHTARGNAEYRVEARAAIPGYGVLEALVARSAKRGPKWLLLGPYISSALGARLVDAGIDYLDAAGNCHLDVDPLFFVHVEGHRPNPESDARKRGRTAGHQVLFVLAAKPELASLPVRRLAALAGAGKTQTATVLDRLDEQGVIVASSGGRRVLKPERLVERWLGVYPDVRRRWIRGRFRPSTSDIPRLEATIETALEGTRWAWGGGAAAARLIKLYRGPDTVIHVARPVADIGKRMRALPDASGTVTVLATPIPFAFDGVRPHVPHPLLVYSELVAAGDERAADAAGRIREQYLEGAR